MLSVALVHRRPQQSEVERSVEEPRDLGRGQQLAAEVEHDAGQLARSAAASAGQHRVGRGARESDREAAVLAARRAAGVLDRRVDRGEDARARSSSTSPAGASSTLRVVRYSSGSPSSASKRRICCESGGWAMWSRSAARPKCRSSATATK